MGVLRASRTFLLDIAAAGGSFWPHLRLQSARMPESVSYYLCPWNAAGLYTNLEVNINYSDDHGSPSIICIPRCLCTLQESTIFSMHAMLVYLTWFFGLASLHLALPGKTAQGVVLPDGSRLNYKLNAFLLFCLIYGSALYLGFFTPFLNLSWIYDNYLPLLTATIIFSSALSCYLYIKSFGKGSLLSSHGCSGYIHYDFWMGRELNPRVS
jgi:hypothetical protein